MKTKTGQTIYETIISVNPYTNLPVTGATFSVSMFVDGVLNNYITPSLLLIESSSGAFSASFTPTVYGIHQMYVKNIDTNVLYVSDIYSVLSDVEVDPSPTIYVGL